MLEIYLLSVAIWMNVNSCVLNMLNSNIKKNGWTDDNGRVIGAWGAILVGSAIPFIRLLVLFSFIAMSIYTKEQFDKTINDLKKDMEE